MLQHPHRATPAALAIAALTLISCGTPKKPAPDISLASGVVTPSPSPSPSPVSTPSSEATAALAAAVAALNYQSASYMKPFTYDPLVARKYFSGTVLSEFTHRISSAQQLNLEFRGTPPTPHLAVTKDASADATPSVVLTDCMAVPQDYRQYSVATAQPVSTATPLPPFAFVLTLTKSPDDTWVISQTSAQVTTSCVP